MYNRADTDHIRDDIRTLGSAVARPCALACNSLGASQDRRGICRGTVAAGADGPRGAALLPAVAALSLSLGRSACVWIHAEQPGNITQQVDAALLRAGTRWCPRLADLTEWQDGG